MSNKTIIYDIGEVIEKMRKHEKVAREISIICSAIDNEDFKTEVFDKDISYSIMLNVPEIKEIALSALRKHKLELIIEEKQIRAALQKFFQ